MPTVEVAPRGPRPPIRVRPAPRCEPPFDDELEPEVWATANQLAFEWPRAEPAEPARPADQRSRGSAGHRPPRRPAGRPGPAAVPIARGGAGRPGGARPPGRRSALRACRSRPGGSPATRPRCRRRRPLPPVVAGASSDAKLAVRRFVHMCVEVLNGYRPPAHLRRLALPKEAADVVAQAVAGTSRVAQMRRPPPHTRPRARTSRDRWPSSGCGSASRAPAPSRRPSCWSPASAPGRWPCAWRCTSRTGAPPPCA